MHPAQLIAEYGYLAVFAGTLLEGETILVLAGFAAHQGYLSLPLVVAVACCGGVMGDQTFFLLGRHFGPGLLRRFPRLAAQVEQVDGLLSRYRSWLIVGFRFLYGLRVAGPVAMGMGGVAARRFLVFNLAGAVAWALAGGGAGYLFGHTLELAVTDLKSHEGQALLGLLCLCLTLGLGLRAVRLLRRRRAAERPVTPGRGRGGSGGQAPAPPSGGQPTA